MAPGEYDYEVVGGDCLPIVLRFKDDDENIINLGGYDARLTFTWRGGSLEIVNDDSPTRIVIEGPEGRVSVELTGAETEGFPLGRLTKYEVVLIQPDGCERTYITGYVVRH
jgi:hypothetical protein